MSKITFSSLKRRVAPLDFILSKSPSGVVWIRKKCDREPAYSGDLRDVTDWWNGYAYHKQFIEHNYALLPRTR